MKCVYCNKEIENRYREISYAKEIDFNCNNIRIVNCCCECEDKYKKQLRNTFTQEYNDRLQELKETYAIENKRDRRKSNKKAKSSKRKLNKSKKYKIHKTEKFYIISSEYKER